MTDPSTCRRSREGLTEYLEKALPPGRRQGIERHLLECESCREQLKQVGRLLRTFGAEKQERMPARMKQRLLAALAQRDST